MHEIVGRKALAILNALEKEGKMYICLNCGYTFELNIDGCPECGSQRIIEEDNGL